MLCMSEHSYPSVVHTVYVHYSIQYPALLYLLTQSGVCSVQGGIGAAPGGSLELVVADITKPDSLKADLFQGVRAVICCTAVNVTPKEGDTPNRDKYKQVGSSSLAGQT